MRLSAAALLLLVLVAPAFGERKGTCQRKCRRAVQTCLLASPGLSRRDCQRFVWSTCGFIGLVGTWVFPGSIGLSVSPAVAISSPVPGEALIVRLTSLDGAVDAVRGGAFSLEAPDRSTYVADPSSCYGWLEADSSVTCAFGFAPPVLVDRGTIVFDDGHYRASAPFVLTLP